MQLNRLIFPEKAAFTTIEDDKIWTKILWEKSMLQHNCIQTKVVVYAGTIVISFANTRWEANR